MNIYDSISVHGGIVSSLLGLSGALLFLYQWRRHLVVRDFVLLLSQLLCLLLKNKLSCETKTFLPSVDSIRWVRPDSIILGCFQLTSDGKEENYLVQVITSKDGKFTDVSI